MKKIYLLFAGLILGSNAYSQSLPVSTTPENKKALLEEFTGMYCTYCPDGHVIANNLKNQYGSNFYVVNIHTGSFATPDPGAPDFRTPFGSAIAGQTALTGYPAGTINRRVFAGLGQSANGTAMGRGNWSNATNQIRQQSSCVNIAIDAEVNEQTRQLKVIVQYYYTDTSAVASNKLNIALLQNNVEGPQTGASNFNPGNILPNGNYNHQHMLRHLLTGQFGVNITNTLMGSTSSDTFTYSIPATLNNVAYDLSNLEVIAFIAEGQQQVLNATGMPVRVVNHINNLDASVIELEQLGTQCPGSASEAFNLRMRNNGGTTITSADIEYTINGGTPATYNWTGSIAFGQVANITLPTVNFTVQPTNTFNINILTVNGSSDNVATNNTAGSNFNEAASTNSSTVTIRVTLDNYGSENSWELRNSAGALVASRLAFADGLNGTVIDTVLTLPSDCYSFRMNDSFGDGMCCGYGNGSFQILGGGVLISGTNGGTFGSSDTKKFTVNSLPSGINEAADNSFKVYPNPASTDFNIGFASTINEGSVRITDIQGRVVLQENINNVDFHSINVSGLENGFYFVTISADGKTQTEKLTVIK